MFKVNLHELSLYSKNATLAKIRPAAFDCMNDLLFQLHSNLFKLIAKIEHRNCKSNPSATCNPNNPSTTCLGSFGQHSSMRLFLGQTLGTGQSLGRLFNFKYGHLYTPNICLRTAKLPILKYITQP